MSTIEDVLRGSQSHFFGCSPHSPASRRNRRSYPRVFTRIRKPIRRDDDDSDSGSDDDDDDNSSSGGSGGSGGRENENNNDGGNGIARPGGSGNSGIIPPFGTGPNNGNNNGVGGGSGSGGGGGGGLEGIGGGGLEGTGGGGFGGTGGGGPGSTGGGGGSGGGSGNSGNGGGSNGSNSGSGSGVSGDGDERGNSSSGGTRGENNDSDDDSGGFEQVADPIPSVEDASQVNGAGGQGDTRTDSNSVSSLVPTSSQGTGITTPPGETAPPPTSIGDPSVIRGSPLSMGSLTTPSETLGPGAGTNSTSQPSGAAKASSAPTGLILGLVILGLIVLFSVIFVYLRWRALNRRGEWRDRWSSWLTRSRNNRELRRDEEYGLAVGRGPSPGSSFHAILDNIDRYTPGPQNNSSTLAPMTEVRAGERVSASGAGQLQAAISYPLPVAVNPQGSDVTLTGGLRRNSSWSLTQGYHHRGSNPYSYSIYSQADTTHDSLSVRPFSPSEAFSFPIPPSLGANPFDVEGPALQAIAAPMRDTSLPLMPQSRVSIPPATLAYGGPVRLPYSPSINPFSDPTEESNISSLDLNSPAASQPTDQHSTPKSIRATMFITTGRRRIQTYSQSLAYIEALLGEQKSPSQETQMPTYRSVNVPVTPSPIPPPSPNPSIHLSRLKGIKTVARQFSPSLDDELEVEVGDRVRIIKVFEDGWALVERVDANKRGDGQGLIPVDCVRDSRKVGTIELIDAGSEGSTSLDHT